jgi:hypothetical protein
MQVELQVWVLLQVKAACNAQGRSEVDVKSSNEEKRDALSTVVCPLAAIPAPSVVAGATR